VGLLTGIANYHKMGWGTVQRRDLLDSVQKAHRPMLDTDSEPIVATLLTAVPSLYRSRSHVTTDGQSVSQSVSMSRSRAHSGTCGQILLSVRRLLSETVLSLWGALPGERSGLSFVIIGLCLHQTLTIHVFCVSAVYIQYI
jgi:hypothetical protein